MTAHARHRARRVLLGAALTAPALLVVLGALHRPPPPPPPALRVDGWVARELRHVRPLGAGGVLRFAAEEVRLERAPFGVFRLGFARRLAVRRVTVDLRPGPSRPTRGAAAPRVRDRGRAPSALTAVHVDRLRVRLRDAGGRWFKLRAAGCEADFLRRAEVVCRGPVLVRSPTSHGSFDALRFDPRRERFSGVGPHGSATRWARGASAAIRGLGLAQDPALAAGLSAPAPEPSARPAPPTPRRS
jgi:hypothetical protein